MLTHCDLLFKSNEPRVKWLVKWLVYDKLYDIESYAELRRGGRTILCISRMMNMIRNGYCISKDAVPGGEYA